jgi:hypothetical protein
MCLRRKRRLHSVSASSVLGEDEPPRICTRDRALRGVGIAWTLLMRAFGG